MPTTRSILLLSVLALANTPLHKGEKNAAAIKDFNAKMRGIKRQMIALNIYTLNLPLRGRKRIELISSLEDDYVTPTTEKDGAVFMQLFNNVKQMVDKSNMIKNGQANQIKSYRSFAKNARNAFQALSVSNGASRGTSTRTRTNRKPVPPTTE